jgi:hypothetical protein
MTRITRFVLVLTGLFLTPSARAGFITVNLAPYTNARMQTFQPSSAEYPEGAVTLGGVPFNIQTAGGNNVWLSDAVSGGYPHVLSVPLNVFGVTNAFTLINSFYGAPGPASYMAVEFVGTGGAFYHKDLIGNVDVRDHFNAAWTNTINGTTTVNVYSSGGGPGSESRLDMQQYTLPSIFASQTLTEFRLIGAGPGFPNGAPFIAGLTLQSAAAVPEPASITSLVVGAVALAGYARRRRSTY